MNEMVVSSCVHALACVLSLHMIFLVFVIASFPVLQGVSPLIVGGFSIFPFSKLSHLPHFPLFRHTSFSQTRFMYTFFFFGFRLLRFFSSLIFRMAHVRNTFIFFF